MRALSTIVGLGFLALTLPPPAAASLGTIPDVIPDPSSDVVAWVSASIVAPDGELRLEMLDELGLGTLPETIERVHALRQRQNLEPGRCAAYIAGGWDWEEHKPHDSLEELTKHSKAVVSGRVTEVRQGFYYGQLGSLLRIELGRSPKANEEIGSRGELLVYYPWAEIELDGELLCAQNPREPARPEPGTRIIVFVYRGPGATSPAIVYPENEEVIFETRAGVVSLPGTLQSMSAGVSLEAIEEHVEKLAAGSEGPQGGGR